MVDENRFLKVLELGVGGQELLVKLLIVLIVPLVLSKLVPLVVKINKEVGVVVAICVGLIKASVS